MYVCICKSITDKQIKQEVLNGSTTTKALCKKLGVAGQCGKCGMLAKQIIQSTLKAIEKTDDKVA